MFGFGTSNSTFPQTKLVPLIIKLGDFLKQGYEHSEELQGLGNLVDADTLSIFIRQKMDTWNPVINEKEILDDKTKDAASRFLAGIAINLTKKQEDKEQC